MAIRATRVTVGTSATPLMGSAGSDGAWGSGVTIKNPSASTVRVGGDNVTWATGFDLDPGSQLVLDAQGWQQIYGVTESDTVELQVLQIGVQ